MRIFSVRKKEAATGAPRRKKKIDAFQYAGIGLEMGISTAIGIFGGKYLDTRFGTDPIFFWCGFLLGIGAAAKALVTVAAKAKRDMSEDESPQSEKD